MNLKTLLLSTAFLTLICLTLKSQDHKNNPVLEDLFEIETTSVKDQESSEACWSFAGASFIESELIRKNYPAIDISEMYFVRQMYIQRGIDYIRYKGSLNFGIGGHVHDILNYIDEIGFIPQEYYVGNEYNPGYMDIAELDSVLYYFLDEVLKNLDDDWLSNYKVILDKYLGKVPNEFTVNHANYTPVEYYKSFNFNPNDYIEISCFNHHPFYEEFVLEIPDNWSHNRYYNVPLNDFYAIMENSIRNKLSFVWNGDVLNEGFFYYNNICIAPIEENEFTEREVTQEYRQKRFDNFTIEDEHLVHVIGLAEDQNGKLYLKSKNSWGTDDIFYGGYQYMSEQYLKLFTISVVVHKDAIPVEIRNKMKI